MTALLFEELSMPWKIYEESGEFCVHKKNADGSKGEKKQCYASKKEAEDYMRALYTNAEANMSVHLSLEAPSLSERLTTITRAFHSLNDPNPNPYDCYIKEVYDDYLLVADPADTIYKVTYKIGEDGKVEFAPVSDWVKQKLVDAQQAGFCFTELSGTAGMFDGLAASHDVAFVSMSGEELFIEPADLETYMANGMAVIESTRTQSGELVGLPIDMNGHDHKGGAGWIKGFELDKARNIVKFLVEWTDEGVNLIKGNLRRFFSPSVDPINKVILGGSLTNWPASRNSMGQLLLQPVELSQSMKGITMPTIEQQLEEMAARLAELEKPKTPATPSGPAPSGGTEEIELGIAALLRDDTQVDQLGEMAQERAKELVRVAQRKAHVVEFVSQVVGGTPDHPVGLPIQARELTKLLLSLPEKQSLAVERLLAKIWDKALDFAEHGIREGDTFNLRRQVPAEFAGLLNDWVKAGHSAKSFFEVNPEAGSAEDFNLSMYTKKGGE
jgi:hypothetical protein